MLLPFLRKQGDKEIMMGFKDWFKEYGNKLLEGWLRAKEDANNETFTNWVLGEFEIYEIYCEGGKYEVPYHGLLDMPSKAEKLCHI